MAASLLFTPRLSTRSIATASAWSPRGRSDGPCDVLPAGPAAGRAQSRRMVRAGRPSASAGAAGSESVLPTVPLVLVGLLLLLAVLVAPERPRDQAAICQRHAGAEACRVW